MVHLGWERSNVLNVLLNGSVIDGAGNRDGNLVMKFCSVQHQWQCHRWVSQGGNVLLNASVVEGKGVKYYPVEHQCHRWSAKDGRWGGNEVMFCWLSVPLDGVSGREWCNILLSTSASVVDDEFRIGCHWKHWVFFMRFFIPDHSEDPFLSLYPMTHNVTVFLPVNGSSCKGMCIHH